MNKNDLKSVSSKASESQRQSNNILFNKSSIGKSSSSSNSPIKRNKLSCEREITGGLCSCNLMLGNLTYNMQEPGVIQEELCEYEQQIDSPMPRLEENKSSVNEDSFEINDVLLPDEFDVEFDSFTPRFEQDSSQFTIMLCEVRDDIQKDEDQIPKMKTISNLKDPDNYVNYIKSNKEIIDSIVIQYEAVKGFQHEIKKIQKKIRSTSIKQLKCIRQPQDSGSNTDENEILQFKKTVVLEPEDLIFTLKEQKIDGVVPNLVFEQKNEQGKMITQHMYLNQSYKPFLIYLCKTYEVIIYSRIN